MTCSIRVGGAVALALAVDLDAEPAEQGREVAPGERLVQAAQLGRGPAAKSCAA